MHITGAEINQALDRLAFTCSRESIHLPLIDDRAQKIYDYGKFLEHRMGVDGYIEIGRYFRLSAAGGSYKAATNLHILISQGLVKSNDPEKEVIDIVEEMIVKGVPGGYYDMGHYLELGYGVKQDSSRANAYFRRAADLGSPDAQFYVSKLLSAVKGGSKVAIEMRKCAMRQGHAEAALDYGGYMRALGNYAEGLIGFQEGARFGSATSASFLRGGFQTSDPKNRLYYLGQKEDLKRVERYDAINEFLTSYESLGAQVPDIDDIVPLPPAKLPDWDGTFEWQRKRDSTPPPQKPSEEMIRALSQEKGLDPETGLPLSKVK